MKKLFLIIGVVLLSAGHVSAALSPESLIKVHNADCNQLLDIIKQDAVKSDFQILANDDPVQIDRIGNNLLCKVSVTLPDGDIDFLFLEYFHKNNYIISKAYNDQSGMKSLRDMMKRAAAEEKAAGIDGDKINPPKPQ